MLEWEVVATVATLVGTMLAVIGMNRAYLKDIKADLHAEVGRMRYADIEELKQLGDMLQEAIKEAQEGLPQNVEIVEMYDSAQMQYESPPLPPGWKGC